MFTLSSGSTEAVVVPSGTQVAAPPAVGEKDSVIFEMEPALALTPAKLTAVFNRLNIRL